MAEVAKLRALGGGKIILPTRFGKFLLLERIGGGRLSQVYRVGRAGPSAPGASGRPLPVALKRVDPSLIGEPAFVRLIVREASLLGRLSHPRLCACQEMGVIDGCAFLTLSLVEGCTLRALMRAAASIGIELPAPAVLAIGWQLAEVLDYLHRRCPTPLVHLDLSPQNVMLSTDGTIKLIDFGIARLLDGSEPPPLGNKIAGTVGYMSPEQARGEAQLRPAADQFGLGILLWEMLQMKRLFPGNTPQTWQRLRRGEVPNAQQRSPEIGQLLDRLLAPEPERRFADMREVQQVLEQLGTSPRERSQPLAALVRNLMKRDGFDPFDAISRAGDGQTPHDIPRGEAAGVDYAELAISVDHGHGTPSAHMRSAIPGDGDARRAGESEEDEEERPRRPSSPFLEV